GADERDTPGSGHTRLVRDTTGAATENVRDLHNEDGEYEFPVDNDRCLNVGLEPIAPGSGIMEEVAEMLIPSWPIAHRFGEGRVTILWSWCKSNERSSGT
ncbi:MAG: hypothetical protein PVF51_09050, partial [Nitrospirota bacterium]